jgi:hypothetical protein
MTLHRIHPHSVHTPERATAHADTELLSAYLDQEISRVEARALEAHLESCPACRGRLSDLHGVVSSLGRLERAAPPPWLAQQVRHAVATPPPGPWRRFVQPFLRVPLRSPIGSTFSMAVALLLIVLLPELSNRAERRGLPGLMAYPGPVADPYPDPPILTTIVVANRTFMLRENEDVWVELGLPRLEAEGRATPSSPRGKALLARYSDLETLLADGSRVVMRHQRRTLELWSGV